MSVAVSDEHDAVRDFAQRTSEFVEWFRNFPRARLSQKIQLADLRDHGAGRGVVASADIQTDEELFAVPRDVVLSTTTSFVPPHVLKPLEDSGPWPSLIVCIIYEYLKGDASLWAPYFQILPRSFDTLMFWNKAELEELQGSAVVHKIGKASAEEKWKNTIIPLMLEHRDLFPAVGQDETALATELNRFSHFAGSLIMAYAFDIDKGDKDQMNGEIASDKDEFEDDDEDEPLKGMVPFADMLNADADRNNARLFQEEDFFIMKATQPIKAGDEIFNDYGPLPRSDLLRMYGYVTENYAQYDVIEFEHQLFVDVAGMRDANRNKAWLKLEEQLAEIGVIDDGYSLQRPPKGAKLDEYLPGNIHMLVRGLCLDPAGTKIPKVISQESITIEEAALLSAVATKKLSEYSSSLQDDMNILRTMETPASALTLPHVSAKRLQMAVHVRAGEKEILRDIIAMCQSHIAEKTNDIVNMDNKRKNEDDHPKQSKKHARRKP